MFDLAFSASTTLMLTKVKNFFSEVKVELQKASWPWEPKKKEIAPLQGIH